MQAETQPEIVPKIIAMPGVAKVPVGSMYVLHVPNTPAGMAAAARAAKLLRKEQVQRAA